MIELVLENFKKIKQEKKFIFIVKDEDCHKYHLDDSLRLATDDNCVIIKVSNDTKGAACSALYAIDHINNDEPLIISNGDQIIDVSFNDILNDLNKQKADAGLVCFESIHPKYSYARINEHGDVIETAEKRPLTKNAIAGFYYFSKGSLFVNAAQLSIEKDNSVNGIFFIAPTMNELVLDNKRIRVVKIKNEQYHLFYSPQKIKEYERMIS